MQGRKRMQWIQGKDMMHGRADKWEEGRVVGSSIVIIKWQTRGKLWAHQ